MVHGEKMYTGQGHDLPEESLCYLLFSSSWIAKIATCIGEHKKLLIVVMKVLVQLNRRHLCRDFWKKVEIWQ